MNSIEKRLLIILLTMFVCFIAWLIWGRRPVVTPPCPPSPAAAQLDPILTLSPQRELYLDKRLGIRAVIVDGIVVWRRP